MNARVLKIGVWLIFGAVAAGCQSGSKQFDSYTIAFATPRGNKIAVREATFDNSWRVPVGTLSCCWGEAGAGSLIFNKQMPHSVHVEWLQEDESELYEASVTFPSNIDSRVRDLPPFTWISDGKQDKGIYLIVGMKPDGNVVVWLSNARSRHNRKDRVLYVVGRGQAQRRPWSPVK